LLSSSKHDVYVDVFSADRSFISYERLDNDT
jgi:hypothetical protein